MTLRIVRQLQNLFYSSNVEMVQIEKVMALKTDIKWEKCYCDMESLMNDSAIQALLVNTKPEIEKSGFGISVANFIKEQEF